MSEKPKEKKPVDYTILKRLFSFMAPYKGRFIILLLLTVSIAILSPLRPYLIQYTVDNHIANNDMNGLSRITILLIALLILQAIFQYAHTYLSAWLGQHIIKDMRIKLYKHILSLKLKFYDNTPIGRLVTRNISDIETLADVFSQGIAAMMADILTLILIVGVMFWTDWRLTLVSLATVPLLLISTYVFKEKIKTSFNDVRNAVSNLNSFAQEHITGMNIVHIFNAEKREYEKFKDINKKHLKAHLQSVLYYSIYYPVAEVIQATGIGLLVWYFAKGMMLGDIQLGVVMAFIMYIQMFFRPIRQLADRFNTLQMGVVSTERILKLIDSKEYTAATGTISKERFEGIVSFKNVWFAYDKDNYVLKNINLDIKSGETLALVGATGAGKSSIINLLNRFYEINKGSISIDGEDIRNYELDCLRQNIGIVLQDVFLFSNSVSHNISLGNQDFSKSEIEKAAQLVGAHKFIEKLPENYDFDVKERGGNLSVGQRQLIAFVRAMVYNPSILILDEATASVDSETELLIQNAIDKLMDNRTSIVIAHRLSTIQKADKIVVLDHGEIKEIGTHEALLKQEGYYAQLYQMQFAEIK